MFDAGIDKGDMQVGYAGNAAAGLITGQECIRGQVVELTEQLLGRSGERQVEGARVGLAHNGGGSIGNDAVAQCMTILKC
ncbi:MAG: hypothetical protein QF921_09910 [Pseudomonadales bacterium]|nr:hypothetical protein [Pseudomonadales bacterium]MDP6472315.1 hypothetical protein [Pseudomonadales bacterium]MDP6828111.1 hypothetical protein [Pseudomonadales bacterium]MDP6971809.1 hypothetical protein [Pseudomonadales bacterium]